MPEITLTVNGAAHRLTVPDRMLLTDALRDRLGLTGTHVGCEHGVCGACTILMDGKPVRACLTLAVQAEGREIRTIESVAPSDTELHPVQRAMRDCHGLQCGFCTPGIVMSLVALHERAATAEVPEDEIAETLSGHLCRCTGYRNITAAAHQALTTPCPHDTAAPTAPASAEDARARAERADVAAAGVGGGAARADAAGVEREGVEG
ncbi:(2Fe-2S)-binding protein [Actinocorallia sp. A-T 12471]|uniref:(2Fe-2S)-binding protein n=1 Tax=Actinocorallia sp. A-T 12471 TaxID=3089813 RepID=UPI0029D339C9|nr:(2Fe-2S)-binding protein [Actinocorallia sp. A-T 12471]MDX6739585.1 (2Fe-2S)-binding protein [Actinocorallia sp. A-T 12471]